MCAGSSHSDKETEALTPEKGPAVMRSNSVTAGNALGGASPTVIGIVPERKRKRKGDDGGGTGGGGATKPRVNTASAADNSKNIREYFGKHPSNSPVRHGGAKSPSPQQSTYPMVRG